MVCSLDIVVYRTHDMNLVKSLSTRPDIYPLIIDDGCPKAEDYHPIDSSHRYFLVPWLIDIKPIPMGIVAFYALGHVLFEGHIFILPEYQHKLSLEIGQKSLEWLWSHTYAQKVVTFIPITKPHVIKYVTKLGFKEEGFCPGSFSSDQKIIDQYIYGIRR